MSNRAAVTPYDRVEPPNTDAQTRTGKRRLQVVLTGFDVTVGFHRLITHRLITHRSFTPQSADR